MCQFVSFFHNPLTGDIKVHNLEHHGETENALQLDKKIWREGHYLPNGEIVCRLAPEDRITQEEANARLQSRFPTFALFLNWALIELNLTENYPGSLYLRGLTSAKDLKLPSTIGGYLDLRGSVQKEYDELKARAKRE